jgi:lipid II:glycine glycyltransferase (peptidoglycan interpeptide bridge formation enzyme)
MEKINEFLQSDEWRKFQESVGRRIFCISGDNFYASIVEHELPVVGKYFYIPKGPICHPELDSGSNNGLSDKRNFVRSRISARGGSGMTSVIDLAKKEKAGWIRIEPANDDSLNSIKKSTSYKITKAPHDMQPRELFIIDITKPEDQLLAEMKSKTRYNIKLSHKRGVSVKVISNESCHPELDSGSKKNPQLPQGIRFRVKPGMTNNYFDRFIELVKVTAKRDGITPHPENYYRKMFETIPGDILKLYVAEYENKIIAANIIIHYGNTATYLHGASDNEFRNVMAPYLLQWQAILDAKKVGLKKYDFGGVCSGSTALDQNDLKRSNRYNSWQGITKFKTGFSPETKPVEFPGSYDIVINPMKYNLYRIIQQIKSFL